MVLASIQIKNSKYYLLEGALGVTVEDILKLIQGELVVPEHEPEMQF